MTTALFAMKAAADPTPYKEVKPNIFVPSEKFAPSFSKKVRALIVRIEANPIGFRLLEKIRLLTNPIFIRFGTEDKCTGIVMKHKTSCNVKINLKDSTCLSTSGNRIPIPKHVILFHELVHGYHILSSKIATTKLTDPVLWESDEEYKTIVGFPSKKGKTTPKITENSFRLAEDLPERFEHSPFSKPNHKFYTLVISRIKLLARIHARNKLISPESSSPPPIALCSINELGLSTNSMFFIDLDGVDFSLAPKKNSSYVLLVTLPSPIKGTNCYANSSNREEEKEIIACIEPKLAQVDFKVNRLCLLRISQLEHDIVTESMATT